MQHLVIRTGSRIRRRLGIIIAVAALIVAVVFLLRPRRWFGRPDLELVAMDANGLFQDSVSLPRAWADTAFKGAYGATARVPLVLGVRNVGSLEGGASALQLSLPARYRLESADGKELPHRGDPGNPLIQYTIKGPFPPVEPGRLPTVLPSVDTVWLEPMVPPMFCVAVGDSVPEFIPAGEPNSQALSQIAIFYSFDQTATRGRQAGLLSVRLDPSLVARPPAEPPPTFPTRIQDPAWPLPQLGELHRTGFTVARCGPPESPMEVQSTVWQGETGGRLIILSYGGKPRKYLFDLNGDGTIDLEMWDAAGRGRFNAQRAARYPIPPFLLPPAPTPFDPSVFAGLPPDSASRLYAFREAGFYRPTTQPEDSASALQRFRGAGPYTPRTGRSATGVTPMMATPPPAAASTPAGPRVLGQPVEIPRPDSSR